MTDNEIIQALECCTNPKVGEICPRANFADVCTDGCVQVLMVQTLELIKRKDAELAEKIGTIMRLQQENEKLKKGIKDADEKFSTGEIGKGLAIIINLVKEMVGADK